jgi:hypothetical protein
MACTLEPAIARAHFRQRDSVKHYCVWSVSLTDPRPYFRFSPGGYRRQFARRVALTCFSRISSPLVARYCATFFCAARYVIPRAATSNSTVRSQRNTFSRSKTFRAAPPSPSVGASRGSTFPFLRSSIAAVLLEKHRCWVVEYYGDALARVSASAVHQATDSDRD